MVLLVLCLYKIVIKKQQENFSLLAMTAFLLAYFMNFSRMLGRHSLSENMWQYAFVFFYLAVLFFGAVFKPKYKIQIFIGNAIVLPLLFIGFSTQKVVLSGSMLQSAFTSMNKVTNYADGVAKKIDRVNYNQLNIANKSILNMMSTIMLPDETYIDLSSENMLYALTSKEKPVYINQSPLHLSGEFTQEQFIRQIENYGEKCNYVLFRDSDWGSLDGIENTIRYYKVYEYLNTNFRPLCGEDEQSFKIWVRKENFDEAKARIPKPVDVELSATYANVDSDIWQGGVSKTNPKKVILNYSGGISKIDGLKINDTIITTTQIKVYKKTIEVEVENQTDVEKLKNSTEIKISGEYSPIHIIDYDNMKHSHNYKILAYQWGEFDTKKAANNPQIKDLKDTDTILQSEQSQSNYVLVNAKSDTDQTAELIFKTPDGKEFKYSFLIKKAEYNYLVRISTDGYWGQGDLTYKLTSQSDIMLNKIALLAGD